MKLPVAMPLPSLPINVCHSGINVVISVENVLHYIESKSQRAKGQV
jgi:hypothetical protein